MHSKDLLHSELIFGKCKNYEYKYTKEVTFKINFKLHATFRMLKLHVYIMLDENISDNLVRLSEASFLYYYIEST